MRIRGIVRVATLEDDPPGSDRINMLLRVQGVKPGEPRLLVVPYELLLGDESLDPEHVQGHGFEAEINEDPPGRWLVAEIAFASGRVLAHLKNNRPVTRATFARAAAGTVRDSDRPPRRGQTRCRHGVGRPPPIAAHSRGR